MKSDGIKKGFQVFCHKECIEKLVDSKWTTARNSAVVALETLQQLDTELPGTRHDYKSAPWTRIPLGGEYYLWIPRNDDQEFYEKIDKIDEKKSDSTAPPSKRKDAEQPRFKRAEDKKAYIRDLTPHHPDDKKGEPPNSSGKPEEYLAWMSEAFIDAIFTAKDLASESWTFWKSRLLSLIEQEKQKEQRNHRLLRKAHILWAIRTLHFDALDKGEEHVVQAMALLEEWFDKVPKHQDPCLSFLTNLLECIQEYHEQKTRYRPRVFHEIAEFGKRGIQLDENYQKVLHACLHKLCPWEKIVEDLANIIDIAPYLADIGSLLLSEDRVYNLHKTAIHKMKSLGWNKDGVKESLAQIMQNMEAWMGEKRYLDMVQQTIRDIEATDTAAYLLTEAQNHNGAFSPQRAARLDWQIFSNTENTAWWWEILDKSNNEELIQHFAAELNSPRSNRPLDAERLLHHTTLAHTWPSDYPFPKIANSTEPIELALLDVVQQSVDTIWHTDETIERKHE